METKIKEVPAKDEDSPKTVKFNIAKKVLHDSPFNHNEGRKLLHNLREILKNSNATLIKRVIDVNFFCAYCDYQNPKPDKLKQHTISTHSKDIVFTSMRRMSALEFVAKLDITSLHCKICNLDIETLEELLQHLQTHKIKIHTDVHNQILPFKFGTGPLTCFICDGVFPNFKMLNVHVNIHYRNFICGVCGVGFVNWRKLKLHDLTHRKGSYKCPHCPKIFTTHVSRKSHYDQVHGTKNRLKCGHCDERFPSIVFKEKHMTEVHGIAFPSPKCEPCDKVFAHRKALSMHIKRVHLMDRRHACTECDMKFCATGELKKHMLKHTGDRTFQCDICQKMYSRKNTLKEHMRIHANDRRFKCEHCGMKFVQKCSWRTHMRSKHDVIV